MQGRSELRPAVRHLFTFGLFLFISGCMGGEQSNVESDAFVQAAETQYDHELSGSVGDGPIVGAAMRVLAADGAVIAELLSDSSAEFNITVRTKGDFYPLTIDATSGTDLVTNLEPDFDLFGAVLEPSSNSIANLSPFSTIAVELARNLNGGLTAANLIRAETIVVRELNSGLDTLARSSVMWSAVDPTNVAEIVRASEALGETVRRVRDLQTGTGRASSGNTVVSSVAADLLDEVVDGLGGQNVDPRVAALTVVVSSQTLLEAMQNELRVADQIAMDEMQAAIDAVSAPGTTQSFEELSLTAEMLRTVRIGLDAALAVAPSAELAELHDAADGLQTGMSAAMVRSLVPDTYRNTLSLAISSIANGTDADIDTVNTISREGGESASSVNEAPIISGTPPTTVEEGAAYAFTPTANDPDGDTLTFTITGQPAWATFDPATGTLSGTPATGQAGTYPNILIRVSDGEFTSNLAAFTITVSEPDAGNMAPSISGSPPTSVVEGSSYSFAPTASDPDGDALTFTISGQPAWASFDTLLGTLSGVPAAGQAGTYSNILISVSDGELTSSLPAFTIIVNEPPNTAPSISGSPPTSVEEGAAYAFTPTANDPDGDTLTFTITGQPAWATFDPATGTLSGTPATGQAGTYPNILIRVSDGELTSALPTFTITVTAADAVNTAPTISGTPPATVEVGMSYTFTPIATDPEGDTLTFSIQGLPAWAEFDTGTGTVSGTPAVGNENVYSNIVVSVSDGEFTDSLGPFSIEVTAAATGGSVTLTWTAPTQNEDGSTLTDLAGYKLYWGTTPGTYTESLTIDNASVTTYTIDGLASGTYEFVATSIKTSGVESIYSGTTTKTVP